MSFLGLANVSDVSWGTNLYWAQNNAGLLIGAWWTFIPSGLCIALVAFGLVADQLRDGRNYQPAPAR